MMAVLIPNPSTAAREPRVTRMSTHLPAVDPDWAGKGSGLAGPRPTNIWRALPPYHPLPTYQVTCQ